MIRSCLRLLAPSVAATLAVFSISSCAYNSSVWLTPWDAASTASVMTNRASITEVNPVWYTISKSGEIVPNWNAEDPRVRKAFARHRLVPTIQNFSDGHFDPAVVEPLMATAEGRDRHVAQIIALVQTNRYDGIEIDYEHLPASMRSDFSSFITTLGRELRRRHKRLAVTVIAKDRDTEDWPGPAGQDWRVIGAAASTVKIMAYDAHFPGGTAGPLAPIDWLDRVAIFAKQTIPSHKQVFGLAWYGYDWLGTEATTITWPQAVALAKSNNVIPSRDQNGELSFHYEGHDVWFQDAESYRIKTAYLIRHHPWIGGFAHWRSGTEDPEVWVAVGSLNRHAVR